MAERWRGLFRRRTLRFKAVLMVLGVVILPQAFVVLWSAMERDIAGAMRGNVEDAANEAAEALESSRANALDRASTDDWLLDVASRHVSRIRVFSGGGKEIVDCDRDHGSDLVHEVGTLFFGPDGAPTLKEFDDTLGPVPARPEIAESAAAPIASGCRTSPGAKLLVCHAVRIFPNADGTHEVIYVQASSRRAVRALYDLRYQLARLSLVTLPFALLLAWWMGTRMVTPIEELQKEVLEAAASAGPAPALTTTEGDEMGDLARAFNALLGSLEERRGANERFVADLVHELKNPVATIRACAEALGAGAVDEARAERLAKALADSSTRLDTLVSQFLEIARAEAGMPSEDRAPVDLGELARGIAEAMRARHPAVTFDVTTSASPLVLGVPHRLDSVIRNLVENAASFASDGGRVEIALAESPTTITLRVTDTGPGIPEEDLAKVFTRFFTTRGRERGTGLGLALVRAVVEAHGGAVSASNAPAKGAAFEIALPRFTNDSHEAR